MNVFLCPALPTVLVSWLSCGPACAVGGGVALALPLQLMWSLYTRPCARKGEFTLMSRLHSDD